jgi:hypothetical protein
MTNALKILVRKPQGKKTLGRQRRRWETNMKMDLTEIILSVVLYGCETWCPHPKENTYSEGCLEQGAGENIWISYRGPE